MMYTPANANPHHSSTDYHFVDRWRVRGTLDEVAAILFDSAGYTRWWPSTYRSIHVLHAGKTEPGPDRGEGQVGLIQAQGWLPYTLSFVYRSSNIHAPHGFTVEAWGDLTGRGIWTLTQDSDFADITYDWRVRADKPILRTFSFLLKPLFRHNHTWSMRRGEQSLKLELARRRARTADELARIPPPPQPINATPYVLLALAGLLILLKPRRR